MNKEKNIFDLLASAPGPAEESGNIKMEKISRHDIAIIGIGVKFPLAGDIRQFWYNLREGVDCIRPIPSDRKKDVETYFRFMDLKLNREPQGEGMTFEEAAYLERVDTFDYRFFRLSPREANLMDPNQRLFLETAWSALEDAGYGGVRLVGSRTGVYVGFGGESEYKKLIADVEPNSLSLAVPANLPPIIASRLSYLLDFKGPSLLVNTVCSSSLVAVHLACQAIRSSECDFAVVGGVQTYVLPLRQARVGIESSDYRTKSFDDNSDGTGSGEGAAAILLKPLSQALSDRDHIYAVIKGSAVNQDGRSIGISAPNPAAQEDVLIRAWQDAGIDPETISYIEAHGTGTKLGDPIEIEGIQRAFARYTDNKQFCAIGSVKSNMGHLDNSAGIAGLIKAVLALKNKEIPPTLHFKSPNRKIAFHRSPVYVNDMLTPWESSGGPRRCGVSSFSFSGTNCHVVVEEAPEVARKENQVEKAEEGFQVITLSAETREGLKRLLGQYQRFLQENTFNLADVCFTANTGRGHYGHRLAIIIKNRADFTAKISGLDLDNIANGGGGLDGVYYGVTPVEALRQEGREPGIETAEKQIQIITADVNEKIRSAQNPRNDETLLGQVCEGYVKGAEIQWAEFYYGYTHRRVSLPTYPFASHRCWLQIPDRRGEGEPYYTFDWKPQELPLARNNITSAEGACLILKDRRGLGERIARGLEERGIGAVEVEVEPGCGFQELGKNKYRVSGLQEDYEKLLAGASLKNLRQVLHLLSIRGEAEINSAVELEKQLEVGVYGLFYLVRAIQVHGDYREGIDIVLISDFAHEVTRQERFIHPGNAALFGLGKVVNMEDFNLRCRAVDIDEETGVEALTAEINAGYTDYKVAYRRGKRYVEELERVTLSQTDSGSLNKPGGGSHRLTIQPQGVYVITGGTGGLGLEVAGWLAARGSGYIALISRSAMPERSRWPSIKDNPGNPAESDLVKKIQAVEEIEKKGAEVLCCPADVSEAEEIEKVLGYLRERYQRINGIVHCAAVGTGQAGKLIKEDDPAIFRQVIAPKIRGTWLLDRFTRQDKPDFFVVFSSSITLMGGRGSGSYTAGNTYLNAFASYRGKVGLRTLAMCWAAWEETLKKLPTIGMDKGKHLFQVQSTAEILQAFSEILVGDRDVPVVITGRLNYKSEIFHLGSRLPFRLSTELRERVEKYRGHTTGDSTPGAGRQVPPVRLKGREDGQYQQLERQMAQVFGEFLGYPEISIYDNFYTLGGDSIIAAKMVRAANQLPGVNLLVEDLLRYPTIKELANLLNTKNGDKARTNGPMPALPTEKPAINRTGLIIPAVEKKDYYPASDFQEALFTFSQLKGSKGIGTAYNLPSALLVEGELDGQRIRAIFQQLVDRHEALRTSFGYIGKTPVQRIHDKVTITMDDIEVEPGKEIPALIKDFVKPFDLGQAPLLNVRLVGLGAGTNRSLLLIDVHHIIADGQSGVNLMKDFFDLYGKKRLTPLSIQFKDYLDWFAGPLNQPLLSKQEKYWLGVFKEGVPELHMPLDRPRPWLQSFKSDSVCLESSEELKPGLNEAAAKNATTLFMVLVAALDALLFKYTGDEDIVIGAAVAGRRFPQLEPLVGSFVNILALRNSPGKQPTFKTLLEHVKVNLIQAFENQDYPFGQLARKLDTGKQLGRNPICDVTLALQNQERISMEIDGLVFTPQPVGIDALDIDLNFNIREEHNRLFFRLEYCSKLYKRETASALLTDYINVLETIIRDDTIPLKDILKDKNI